MALKSLIIFALVASVGRVMAVPLSGGHLGARNSCQGIWCARHIIGDGHSDLSRRLAEFDGNNVTLSSGTPVEDPSSLLSMNPSSTSSQKGDPVTETPKPMKSSDRGIRRRSSSTSDGIPQATDPAAGGPATVTVFSTVFLNPADPAASMVSSSPMINPSFTVSGKPSSSMSVKPSATVPGDVASSDPSLSKPTGIFSSVSPPENSSVEEPSSTSIKANPTPTPSPTIIELTNGIPSSSISSSKVSGQPTPSPTPGIIFLPPSDGTIDFNP
ncbi:hypothetical protein BDM02DRAFT_3187236 [Thelephora ganbajun]|uniref:Uncharacterized protein n=1 Tax=Thelephora ganbajun TaxID=370292 RepID=A0ACB6ZF05_THEGA|nr:hypothetical protein BDM02DRAFT_3187236 [Thelephora ganbajun]